MALERLADLGHVMIAGQERETCDLFWESALILPLMSRAVW
jgi:hypothetical protein